MKNKTKGPKWKCNKCKYKGRDFKTIVYESMDWGTEYDLECPKCEGIDVREL